MPGSWVRTTDPNGYLEMPGSRGITNGPHAGGTRWYHANDPSAAVPHGMGDEETIRAIWAADSAPKLAHEHFPILTLLTVLSIAIHKVQGESAKKDGAP